MRSQYSSLWSQWWRLGGILGVGAIVFTIIGFAIQGMTPDLGNSIEEIREYFAEDGTRYLVGDYIVGLGFVLLYFPFLLSLRSLLGWVEGVPNICSWLAFTGGLLVLVLAYAADLSKGGLALGAAAHPEVSDSVILAFTYVSAYGLCGMYLSGALLVFPSAFVILRTSVLWRWLGALGVVVGILAVVGTAWTIDGDQRGALSIIGLISFFGVLVWILLVSVNMILKRELPDRAAS